MAACDADCVLYILSVLSLPFRNNNYRVISLCGFCALTVWRKSVCVFLQDVALCRVDLVLR